MTPEELDKKIKEIKDSLRCLVCDINLIKAVLYANTTTTTTLP